MAPSGHSFVEWKEQFVSKEKGNRVVHYFLKDVSGEFILAVVGTERSVRHMFYVVSEEFLEVHGADNLVCAGYRWRSRREVVNWLTSMLSKQHRDRSKSPKTYPTSGVCGQQANMPEYKGRLARNLKGHASDIVWSGVAWTCGKQLKHYPAFFRNGITIAVQSFVFVMAEEEIHHLAYLEDMYEDKKGQKKVKVRWFHRNQEVKGVISLRNPHPKEVFITPYAQVISAECVDGPAIVLTREHYEKSLSIIPSALLARVHICFRQFKGNRVKPFKLSKLRGYFDQPILSCLDPNLFEEEEFNNVKVGSKRMRSSREYKPLQRDFKSDFLNRRLIYQNLHSQPFEVNERIELLCQDSGIRGCWFRCTVLQVSRRQMKVQYDDVKDEDGCGNLEEWVPSFRLAMPDKLGIRCPGRLTIRPAPHHAQIDHALEVGAPVDAWWSDGWWEGVVTGISKSEDKTLQVYIPSENFLLDTNIKELRISRDWMGDKWVEIEANRDIISAMSAIVTLNSKLPASSHIPRSCQEVPSKLVVIEGKLDLDDSAPSNDLSGDMDLVNDKKPPLAEDRSDNIHLVSGSPEKENVGNAHSNRCDIDEGKAQVSDGGGLEEFETAGKKSEVE